MADGGSREWHGQRRRQRRAPDRPWEALRREADQTRKELGEAAEAPRKADHQGLAFDRLEPWAMLRR